MAQLSWNFAPSASSGSYIQGKIVIAETVYPASNSSTVQVALWVKKGSTTTTLTIPTEGTWSYKLQLGDTVVNKTVHLSVLTDWVYVGALSADVNHKADGTASIQVVASITAPTGTTLEGHTTDFERKHSITSIDKPTTIDSLTCTKEGQKYDYLDGVITAHYTPKLADLYNQCKIYVMVNGKENEIYSEKLDKKAAIQQTYTIQFTPEKLLEIYGLVKTTTNVTIRVKFITYRNSYAANTVVGTGQYLEIALTLPTSVAPTATLTLTPKHSNSWIAGKNIYVAGLSGATATLSATPSAGIKEEELTTTITYDDVTYNAETLNVTTLKKSGNNIVFTAKVTDPRRRSATATKSITVLPYSAPVIASMQVERGTYNNGWEAADEGSDVRVTFKTTLSLKDNGNTYSAAFKVDGSSKTPYDGAPTGLESGTEYTVYLIGIDGEVSHTLAMTVTDKTGNTGTANITIPTIRITIEFNDSGSGIAFGKTSEHDAFECAWDAEFSGKILHKPAEDGIPIEIGDTGWIELGLSANVSERANAVGHAGSGCKYRVINGNHVYVAFACDVPYSNDPIVVNANAIPQSYRPKQHIYGLSASGGRTITALYVHYNGQIYINYIQQITATSNTTSLTTWVDGYIDYFI